MIMILSIFHTCFPADLTYTVEEGKSPGTYIGDIAADSKVMENISQQDKKVITFSQLQQDETDSSQYFQVSKKTVVYILPVSLET